MNMLNSSTANIEPAASSQASSTTRSDETKTANLVIAKKASTPEPISLPEAEKVIEILNDQMNMNNALIH